MVKILICLMFKNSMPWFQRYMRCVISLLENTSNGITYDLSVIYGDSSDETDKNVLKMVSDITNKNIVNINTLPIAGFPKRLDGIQRLVLLRNMFLYPEDKLKKYDYLLIADTDVIFTPNSIIKLVKTIENSNLYQPGIVAPMIFIDNYSRQNDRYFYDTFAYRIKGQMFTHKRPYFPVNVNINNGSPNRIIEVDSVGSLYLVRADIFTDYNITYRTYKRDFKTHVVEHPHRIYESEQVVLCNDVREKTPYKIYVDMNSRVFHINLEDYGLAWH